MHCRCGLSDPTPISKVSVMLTYLRASWLAAKHLLPHMVANGSGAMVNITSIHAGLTSLGMLPVQPSRSWRMSSSRDSGAPRCCERTNAAGSWIIGRVHVSIAI